MSLTLVRDTLCSATSVDSGTIADSTPYLELDVAAAVTRFRRLRAALPGTTVHYAVKANPDPALLAALATAGCCFDVASPAEVLAALEAGAEPADLVYSHPVKRRSYVEVAAKLGVRMFVVDSLEETDKVAQAAPGASVLCRMTTSGAGADWSLSRKFGCSPREAAIIVRRAAMVGLDPAGISFHVGSQQRDPEAWGPPIAAAARVLDALRVEDHGRWVLDLGGGFPAHLEDGTPPLPAYGAAIERHLRLCFGDEAIRYRLSSTADGGPVGPCVLAGPTCDSADVLYERTPVELPLALAEGDQVRLHSTGAYTSSCSTVGFNGFPPLTTRLM